MISDRHWSSDVCSSYIFFLLSVFFFSSRRRHTRSDRDWSSDVCSSDLLLLLVPLAAPENAGRAKRLEWITWNPVEHILYWEVSEGRYDVHGQYEPERRLARYSLDPTRSTMQHAGDARGFMPEEGDRLHAQLDALAHYTMSSTLWWDGDN